MLIAEPLDGSPAGFLSAGQGVRYRSKFRRRWSRRSAAVFDPTATFEDQAYMLDPDFPLGCYQLLLRWGSGENRPVDNDDPKEPP
jgi:hypothetical protein